MGKYNKKSIAIIGGGMVGLTAGYKLLKQGYEVTIYEREKEVGGLASGFEINGTNLEKAYHHIFKTDTDVIELTKELGIEDKLEWLPSSIGLIYQNKVYPFVTPIDLLKFPHLNLVDKLRLGLVAIYLQKTQNWERFKKITASDWMEKWCGKRAFEVIWKPLLSGKYHQYADKVAMAWLWARINTRGNSKSEDGKEYLGYYQGGFHTLISELSSKIKKLGGEIKTGVNIEKITGDKEGRVLVSIDGKKKKYDKVLAAVPNNVLARLVEENEVGRNYLKKLNSIDYLGAIVTVFTSSQSLSQYYWHNVNDISSPFLAFIQHTNLVNKSNYGGEEVYYAGTYVPHAHRYFSIGEKEIRREFFDRIKKVFPQFDKNKVTKFFTFRLKNAQHVVDTDYEKKKLAYKTPIKNLYLANFSQIYPEDRGINYAIRQGKEIAKMISG